jgi:hypothetical protein
MACAPRWCVPAYDAHHSQTALYTTIRAPRLPLAAFLPPHPCRSLQPPAPSCRASEVDSGGGSLGLKGGRVFGWSLIFWSTKVWYYMSLSNLSGCADVREQMR